MATAAGSPTAVRARRPRGGRTPADWLKVAAFLLPALIILGALLVYPIIFTAVRSTFDVSGNNFVGLDNYRQVFGESRTLVALRNNIIWVFVVPVIVTSLGMILAVLSNQIAWRSVFRMFIFLPLVVSGLAAGVTFRFLLAADPETGSFNAVLRQIVHIFEPPGPYPTARPAAAAPLQAAGAGLVTPETVAAGDTLLLGLVGVQPARVPEQAEPAVEPASAPGAIEGLVWLDVSVGGTPGVVDAAERGLPDVRVELLQGSTVAATALTDASGRFSLPADPGGEYRVRLSAANFRQPFPGVAWLGPALVTPSIMIGYIWMQTGFALIIIGAGLSGLDRQLLEAGRIEGANEWQVFRHITVPLLMPVLSVVMVTTVISVLKIFDLVLIIAPESMQANANVLALEMWRASFGGARNFGLGSAIAIVLFLLIVPAMLFNLRRFRMES